MRLLRQLHFSLLLLAALPCAASDGICLGNGGALAKLHGADAYDNIGAPGYRGAIAVGDLNNDGVIDLVLTAAASGPANTRDSCGEAWVVFGPVTAWGERDLAAAPPDVVVYGREVYASLVTAAVGDLDGDGVDDLAFGEIGTRRPDLTDSARGEVCILFGPLASGVIDTAAQEPDFCITGPAQGDEFGVRVAIGDISGDGRNDLVVGAETSSVGAPIGGAVVGVYGPFSRGPIRHLSVVPPDLHVLGSQTQSMFGHDFAVGDLSGDGIADIAMTAPLLDALDGRVAIGRVDVVFGGKPSGTVLDLRAATTDVVMPGVDELDNMGGGIDIADVNGDGRDDLIATAPGANGPGNALTDPGEAHVVFGPLTAGLVIDQVAVSSDVILVGPPGTGIAWAVSAMRRPGGPAALLLGTPFHDQCNTGGTAYLLDGVITRGIVDLSSDPAELRWVVGCGGDQLGQHVLLRDLDGDGQPDPILGAEGRGPARDRPQAGTVFVVQFTDACERTPSGLSDASVFVRRSGDDVLLDVDTAGTGRDDIGIDVYRGTIAALHDALRPRYDYGLMPNACGLTASPARDAGVAAPGITGYYYLATRACESACEYHRDMGSLDDSSSPPRPIPLTIDRTCP